MTETRRALVIGAAGQDGSYLCEALVEDGYRVVGVVRSAAASASPNLASVVERIDLVQADLAETHVLEATIRAFRPHELYNLASVSFGPDAWTQPMETARLGTVAIAALLDMIRKVEPGLRFFQSSSSWVFGQPERSPQTEDTPRAPIEPYGAAKAFGDFLIRAYRHHHGMFACSGIFYNHESPRRPERFVTRKVTRAAAAIKLGQLSELTLGDIEARRDWGYAKDYVQAIRLMLAAPVARDYVVATGETHSIRELLDVAFGRLGLDWQAHVRLDSTYRRGPAEIAELVGDATAARESLGWAPTVTFEELIGMMVDADLAELAGTTAVAPPAPDAAAPTPVAPAADSA